MVDVAEKEPKTLVNFPAAGDMFVGRFKIDAVLNRGGFGCVYKATQVDLKRPVAIKVLRPASRVGFNDDSNAEAKRLEVVAKRLEREAQLVSQLRDPHTVMMYEFGQTPDGLLFMILEYINGRPLSAVVEEEGAQTAERAVHIIMQVLSSLEEAHARGMLHRDIKPPNIMLYDLLDRRDQVKVLDFGLAKAMDDPVFNADNPDLTDDEVLIGTPRYMSPEQIRGHKLGPSTDIYSLGLVFYELLAGEKAVSAKSTMNTLARHINEIPIRLPDELEVDNRLRVIVNKMLDKDVARRYQSASEVMKELEAWKADPWADVVEFEEIIEPVVPQNDNKKWIAVGVVIAVLLMLVFYFALRSQPADVIAENNVANAASLNAATTAQVPLPAQPQQTAAQAENTAKEPAVDESEIIIDEPTEDTPPQEAVAEKPVEKTTEKPAVQERPKNTAPPKTTQKRKKLNLQTVN